MSKKLKINVLFIAALFIWGNMMETQGKNKKDLVPIYSVEKDKVEMVSKIDKPETEWENELTCEAFEVTRNRDTEKAFTGAYYAHKEKGVYQCVACGTDLFVSKTKYESGSGWPSFWEPVHKYNVKFKSDHSHHMERTEVLCARCDSHLGHVFDDGPEPTGKRYCINSAALKFKSE